MSRIFTGKMWTRTEMVKHGSEEVAQRNNFIVTTVNVIRIL